MSNLYEIKEFLGGISPFEDRGIKGAFKFGKNLSIRKKVDSLSCNQALIEEGLHSSHSPSSSTSPSLSVSRSVSPSPSASPSPTASPSASASFSASVSLSPSTTPSSSGSPSPSPSNGANVSTIFQDLIHWFVKATDGYTYGFGNTGYIYRRDSSGYWQIVYKDPNGAILGAAEWYSDTGKTYLYWATLRQLNRKPLPGLANWNDVNVGGTGTWPKTNLESADWHTMTEGGGSLIIANRQFVALVGYDDSYTNEFINLIPGNMATTLVERNGRTIVGTARVSDPARSINAAIDSEVPLAQVGSDGEIFFANMSDSIAAKRFPGGGKVNPGGVCNEVNQANFFEVEQNSLNWIDKQSVGNMSLWGVYNADSGYNGIYSYGRKDKDKPFVMNMEYEMDVDEIGALTNANGTTLASYRDGSTFGVRAVDSTTKAEAVYEGLDFRPKQKLPVEISVWKQAELQMEPLPAGAWIEFWYRINKDSDFIRAYTADGSTQRFSTANSKKAIFRIQRSGEVFEPRVVLHPATNDSPEVYKIVTYFS